MRASNLAIENLKNTTMGMRQLKIQKSITNRESWALDKYLSEIAKIPMNTEEEEVILAQKVKTGDEKALEKLVRGNLRFVVSVAKQYQNQGLTLPDLINEGNFGIMKAAKKYDETRGFKFISYAVWWIRQSILQALAEQSRIVRLPQNKIGFVNKYNKAYTALEQEFEREPSLEEIAEFANLDPEKVNEVMLLSIKHASLDAPVQGTEDISLGDLLKGKFDSPDKNLRDESLQIEIERAFSCLSTRQKEVLNYFYGLNGFDRLNFESIGDKFNLKPERIRQIKEKAIEKLKARKNSYFLKDFLG